MTANPKKGRPVGSTTGRHPEKWKIQTQACLTPEQRAKLKRLGGAEWVRGQIDKAKEPV